MVLRKSVLKAGKWLHNVPKNMGPRHGVPGTSESLYPMCCSETQSYKTHNGLENVNIIFPCFMLCKPPRFCSYLTGRKLNFLFKENKCIKYFLFIKFLKRLLPESFEKVLHLFLLSKTKQFRHLDGK